VSVYPMLDREGQAVTAGGNGKVIIFRVTWTESVLLVPP
jgi:hypothetical protein